MPNGGIVTNMGNSMVYPMTINSLYPRNMGFIGRTLRGIKSFNWGGLLNGANKTLNVVNQTIPLVKQAGPMFNNMRSMIRLARAFGNETYSKQYRNGNNIRRNANSSVKGNNNVIDSSIKKKIEKSNDNSPIFFTN